MELKFNSNCKTLSIYAFNEVLKTSNYRYLINNYDEFNDSEIKLTNNQIVQARMIFKEILYEYSALTFNRNILLNYQAQIAIEQESFKYNITKQILQLYLDTEDANVLSLLSQLRWSFNDKINIEIQIKDIIVKMKRLSTKIALMKIKYNEKFKVGGGVNKIEEEYNDTLEAEAINLEMALKLSYSIDTKKTSVSRWITMINVATKINAKKE